MLDPGNRTAGFCGRGYRPGSMLISTTAPWRLFPKAKGQACKLALERVLDLLPPQEKSPSRRFKGRTLVGLYRLQAEGSPHPALKQDHSPRLRSIQRP